MPAPLSLDLRERQVEVVENGSSIRRAALRYLVSPSAAIKLMQRVETPSCLEPEPSGGRKPLLLEPYTETWNWDAVGDGRCGTDGGAGYSNDECRRVPVGIYLCRMAALPG